MDEELAFWRGFLASQPPNYPDFEDWRLTDVADRPCEWNEWIPNVEFAQCLDVGSGPLLRWGDLGPYGIKRVWTCTDPLEDKYRELRKSLGRNCRANWRSSVNAQSLEVAFGRDRFDFAIASNSLDHSEDPIACIQAMLAVTSGHVVITGFANEGTQAQGQGLHQFDMDVSDGMLLVKKWNELVAKKYDSVDGRRIVKAERIAGRRPSFIAVFETKGNKSERCRSVRYRECPCRGRRLD